jgi:hypothetical protein
MLDYTDHEAFLKAMSQHVPRVYKMPILHFGDVIGWDYGVVGTDYGYLHNTLGSKRLWKSASSAYRWIRKNKEYYAND